MVTPRSQQRAACWSWLLLVLIPAAAVPQEARVLATEDGIILQLVDVDIRAAVQALAPYLDRPVAFGSGIGDARITIESPGPIAREDVQPILRGLLAGEGLELVDEGEMYAVRRRPDSGSRRLPEGAVAGASTPHLYVIRLSHASAVEVAATVNALYGIASALGELGSRSGTLSQQLREQQIPPVEEPAAPGFRAPVATLRGEVVIVPDRRTNALLVRAAPDDFALIEAAVQEIDVRPLQVLVEVLIVEARRDRAFSLGVGGDLGVTSIPRRDGLPEGEVSASNTGLGLGDFAVRVMGIGGLDLDLTLHAAAARGDVSIVSRPILLAANNEVAHILVGSQRPFVQVQRALPTDAPIRDQVIQYRDVGTELTIHPTISEDGYVMLRVTQEVNAATSETAFDAPVISTRAVETNLLVRDRQTVVLGGLMDRQRDATRGGVPILSRLPILGPLFGRTSRRAVETELFVFMTPRILRSDADADAIRDELRRDREQLRRELPEMPGVEPDSVPDLNHSERER